MKKFVTKMSTVVAAMAVLVTSGVVSTSCMIFLHQPELPEGAEELYK